MLSKSPIEKLKNLFVVRRVIELKDVYKVLHTNARITAYRYLQQVGALSSYSHSGKYYTLKDIVEFDEDGLWHYGDISFSKHGTLMNTIAHLVTTCEKGKSCSELEKQQRVYVQNALLALVKLKKLDRKEIDGVYIYVSPDPNQSSMQINQRSLQIKIPPLPEWVVMQVLVATIKCISGCITAEAVALQLRKQGSSISLDQIRRVFQLHSLEKKTPDSAH